MKKAKEDSVGLCKIVLSWSNVCDSNRKNIHISDYELHFKD